MGNGYSTLPSAKIAAVLVGLLTFMGVGGGGVAHAADLPHSSHTSTRLLAPAPTVPAEPGTYRSMAPTRSLDTRKTAPVRPDSSVDVHVTDAAGAPLNAGAVVFNLTVTEAVSFGFVTAYASGTPRPLASNLNYVAGQTVSNLVTVPVGSNGSVSLFNRSSGTVQFIADIEGYYLPGAPAVPGAFGALKPSRLLDTRNRDAVGGDTEVSFQVRGMHGVPLNAEAVVLNLTVTEAASFGFVTAYPLGEVRPVASNLNYASGQTVSNLVTVPLSVSGMVTLFNRSSGKAQLIADIAGYYAAGVPTAKGTFVSLASTRFLDTRLGAPVEGDSAVSFQVAGVKGLPAKVGAVVFNLTVTEPKAFGYVSAYAGGTSRPTASNLNYSAGQTVPNLVTVPVGADGKVTLFSRSSARAQLIADVAGYYVGVEPSRRPVTTTIPVGRHPANIAVDSATHTAYVANRASDTVSVVNGGKVTATISVGGAPSALAVDPGTHTVYVANSSGHSVSVITGTTVTDTIALGDTPTDLAVDPVTHTVYVTNEWTHTLSVINGSQVTNTINVGGRPLGVAVDPVTHTVYVTSTTDGTLSVINGDIVTRTIALSTSTTSVAVDPGTHTVYVIGNSTGELFIINGTSVTTTSPFGDKAPYGVAVDPVTHTVYVAHLYSDMISVINGTKLTATIPTGIAPTGVAVDPGLNTVYVANAIDDTVSSIVMPARAGTP